MPPRRYHVSELPEMTEACHHTGRSVGQPDPQSPVMSEQPDAMLPETSAG
jgi:hypothetical protein